MEVRVERIMPQVEDVPEPPAPDWTPDPLYADWTDEQVAAEYERVRREHERRGVITQAEHASEQALATYRAATGIRDGMQWRQPTGYLDAVQPGETRQWEGRLYENTAGQPVLQSPGDAPDAWTLITPVDPDEFEAEQEPEPTVPVPGEDGPER